MFSNVERHALVVIMPRVQDTSKLLCTQAPPFPLYYVSTTCLKMGTMSSIPLPLIDPADGILQTSMW